MQKVFAPREDVHMLVIKPVHWPKQLLLLKRKTDVTSRETQLRKYWNFSFLKYKQSWNVMRNQKKYEIKPTQRTCPVSFSTSASVSAQLVSRLLAGAEQNRALCDCWGIISQLWDEQQLKLKAGGKEGAWRTSLGRMCGILSAERKRIAPRLVFLGHELPWSPPSMLPYNSSCWSDTAVVRHAWIKNPGVRSQWGESQDVSCAVTVQMLFQLPAWMCF